MKSKDEILEQLYITANDLQILIPKITYNRALNYIKDFRKKMEEKGLFVPEGKTKVALTKLVRKELGI